MNGVLDFIYSVNCIHGVRFSVTINLIKYMLKALFEIEIIVKIKNKQVERTARLAFEKKYEVW